VLPSSFFDRWTLGFPSNPPRSDREQKEAYRSVTFFLPYIFYAFFSSLHSSRTVISFVAPLLPNRRRFLSPNSGFEHAGGPLSSPVTVLKVLLPLYFPSLNHQKS